MKRSKKEFLSTIFSKEGLLSRSLKNFEERAGQREMSETIFNAYEENSVALIEAGTGTGKSLAYLVPAVYWALNHQEKTVIATNTIALQEQLLFKDIPFLLQTLGVELKASLVKGMSNYLCLRKFYEMQEIPLSPSAEEAKETQILERWIEKTEEGSRSDIPFAVSSATWEKIAAEGESCNHVKCPHYKRCFFFKARKQASDAQLLIVNHHFLLSDLEKQRRNPSQESALPSYKRLIIDEAHHLEDIALESFAQRFERTALMRLLAKLHSETHPERSRCFQLKQQLALSIALPTKLQEKLEIDIPSQRRICLDLLEEVFAQLSHFFEAKVSSKTRISEAILEQPFWKITIASSLLRLSEHILRLSQMLQGLFLSLEEFKEAPFFEKLGVALLELQAIQQRLELSGTFLNQFTQEATAEKRVRWIEITATNAILVDTSLDVSGFLREYLFSKQQTSILCSATMTTARNFSFLKKRLGLEEWERIAEGVFESPFQYETRTLFAVPTDFPLPSSPQFLKESAKIIEEAISISRGSAFLLFTSYEMLHSIYQILLNSDLCKRYPFLKQGDLPRHALLEKFKSQEGNVLFGTDSFWEGVDVPGEALRCVIIAKLPFSVPSDPLYEAYTDLLQKEGLDPFLDYSVPQAVIKFKQGFGRLMRKGDDRGCILCLDPRISTKGYGKQFLKSLPPCQTCFAPKAEVLAQMRHLYETTRGQDYGA